MRVNWIGTTAIALLLFIGTAPLAPADQPAVIAAADASAHTGQTATVQGLVANVYVSKKGNEILNFGQAYPNQVFSAVIPAASVKEFGDLNQYQGKQVQVTGVIKMFNKKPSISLTTRDQLRIAP
jgi:hypothetical protein